MTRFCSVRSLAIGFAMGLVVGSAGVAAAAFGKPGWDRFGILFKQGYVAGFIDCVRIAKALDPFSYIATQFPAPPKAKPIVWVRTIDELYASDEHKNRTLAQILIIAGTKLDKAFGVDTLKPNDQRLEALRQAIDRQRKALLKAKKTVQAAQDEIKKNGASAQDSKGAAAESKAAEQGAEKKGDAAKGEQAEGEPGKGESAASSGAKPDGSAASGEKPSAVMPEGSHGMLPEGSHPDRPLEHPGSDSPDPKEHEHD